MSSFSIRNLFVFVVLFQGAGQYVLAQSPGGPEDGIDPGIAIETDDLESSTGDEAQGTISGNGTITSPTDIKINSITLVFTSLSTTGKYTGALNTSYITTSNGYDYYSWTFFMSGVPTGYYSFVYVTNYTDLRSGLTGTVTSSISTILVQ
jgi:hypothetical protein